MPKTILQPYFLKWSVTGLPPFQQTRDVTQAPGTPIRWTGAANDTCISNVIDCRYLDNIAIQLAISGTPTGTLLWQGSNDFLPNPNAISEGTPINAGTWVNLIPSPTAPSGSAYSALANFTGIAFAFLRVNYAPTSGSGFISGLASGSSL
jgi:hypothetical protein